jgi:hypothetical protein
MKVQKSDQTEETFGGKGVRGEGGGSFGCGVEGVVESTKQNNDQNHHIPKHSQFISNSVID